MKGYLGKPTQRGSRMMGKPGLNGPNPFEPPYQGFIGKDYFGGGGLGGESSVFLDDGPTGTAPCDDPCTVTKTTEWVPKGTKKCPDGKTVDCRRRMWRDKFSPPACNPSKVCPADRTMEYGPVECPCAVPLAAANPGRGFGGVLS